jgi:hypothetical protein
MTVILMVVARFTFLNSKSPSRSNTCNLELVISDFNKKGINNAKIYLYESLHAYEEDIPVVINNWEQRDNHYRIIGLKPNQYYFRVVASSLDNSSDIYCTKKKLEVGNNDALDITLK